MGREEAQERDLVLGAGRAPKPLTLLEIIILAFILL